MKKVCLKHGACVAFLLFFTQITSAQNSSSGGYEDNASKPSIGKYVSDVEYKGTATYKTDDYIYELYAVNESEFKPVVENARDITNQLHTLKMQMKGELKSLLENELRKEDADLSSYSFSIDNSDNKVEVSLTGQSNGTIKATLGTFRIRLSATGKYRKAGVTIAEVEVDANTSWFTITGTYDPTTGRVYNTSSSATVDLYYDVDTIFKWLGLDFIVADYIEDEVRPYANDFVSHVNTLSLGEHSLVGLNDVIPSSTYILGGVDVGRELKEALVNAIPQRTLTVEIARKLISYSVNSFYGNKNYVGHTIKVSYDDRYFLEFEDIPSYSLGNMIYGPHNAYYPQPNRDPSTTPDSEGTIKVTEVPGPPDRPEAVYNVTEFSCYRSWRQHVDRWVQTSSSSYGGPPTGTCYIN